VFATADGDVGLIDEASGKAQTVGKTGLRLAGVTIDADGVHADSQSGTDASANLRTTLEQIIWDPDARFTAVKVFATGALGDQPGTEATAALIKIVRAEQGVARPVQKRAGEALIARKDKTADKLLVDALQQHTDFLTNKRAVGVEVLSRAAAEIGANAASPLIGSHLGDSETPQSSLGDLVAALGTLGGKDASRALRAFLLGYRADPMFLHDPSPLTGAGAALAKMSADDRRIVEFVVSEPHTLPPVASALDRLLHPDAAKGQKKAAAAPAGKPENKPASKTEDTPAK
jgi:hypothetical protein